MGFFTKNEKRAYRIGLLNGLKSKKKLNKKIKKTDNNTQLKKYDFLAFNDNCDVFNVVAYGKNRQDAHKNAEKKLKFDPSVNAWKVYIESTPGNFEEYARKITVNRDGSISDNFPYRI